MGGLAKEEVFFDVDEEAVLPKAAAAGKGDAYALHRAAFNNDVVQLAGLLNDLHQSQYTQLDPHGNNALHVAALRGHTEAVQLLLDAGLPAASRSSRGWKALDEALAAHALPAARLLQRQMLTDIKSELKTKRAQLLDSMRQMPDYSLQLKWQLGSSVPGLGMLLRRYAPHDTYTIWKVGDRLRVDGSLMGLDTKNVIPEWKRGHFSLVVDGSPAGLAAAAEAAAAAVAAASAAAEEREQQRAAAAEQMRQAIGVSRPPPDTATQQQQQHEQQQQQGSLGSPAGASCSSSSSSQQKQQPSQQQQHHHQQQQQEEEGDEQFYDAVDASSAAAAAAFSAGDAAGAGAGGGGPRLLFLNHVKGTFMDLSADKKAIKLEGPGQEEEAELELALAMERDVDKLRLKPRNFTFAPVRGWLGGSLTERVEGWRCVVYEATGKLLAVNTSKAALVLPPGATFEDYLSAKYEADAVTETLIDPMSPSGLGAMGGSGKGSSSSSTAAGGQGDDATADGLGPDADDFDGLVWGSESNSSSSGRKKKKNSSISDTGGGGSGGAAAEGGAGGTSAGRLLRARCWMAQDFPMRLSELLPLLDVIGTANKHMAKVGKFLAKYSQLDMFPIKLQVPLLLTVHVLVSFKAFTALTPGGPHPPPGEDFFTVPPHYKRRLLQDAIDKVSGGRMGPQATRGRDLDEYDLDLMAPPTAATTAADAGGAAGAAGRRLSGQQHAVVLQGEDSDAGEDELLVWVDSDKPGAGSGSEAAGEATSASQALERAAADVEARMLAQVPDESAADSSVSGSVAAASGQLGGSQAAADGSSGGALNSYSIGSRLDADIAQQQAQQQEQQKLKKSSSKGLRRFLRRKEGK